jgi:hypothetical protein
MSQLEQTSAVEEEPESSQQNVQHDSTTKQPQRSVSPVFNSEGSDNTVGDTSHSPVNEQDRSSAPSSQDQLEQPEIQELIQSSEQTDAPAGEVILVEEDSETNIESTNTSSVKRQARRKKKEKTGQEELGLDSQAAAVREKILSGAFAPPHPLHALKQSRLLFIDNAKCPYYFQRMDSQSVCCLSNRVDRFNENTLPSFSSFKDGYRRHPALFEGAVKYMVDAEQTYAWQWLLGHNRLMAIPSNALEGNFSPICLERGIMSLSGFVTEKVMYQCSPRFICTYACSFVKFNSFVLCIVLYIYVCSSH